MERLVDRRLVALAILVTFAPSSLGSLSESPVPVLDAAGADIALASDAPGVPGVPIDVHGVRPGVAGTDTTTWFPREVKCGSVVQDGFHGAWRDDEGRLMAKAWFTGHCQSVSAWPRLKDPPIVRMEGWGDLWYCAYACEPPAEQPCPTRCELLASIGKGDPRFVDHPQPQSIDADPNIMTPICSIPWVGDFCVITEVKEVHDYAMAYVHEPFMWGACEDNGPPSYLTWGRCWDHGVVWFTGYMQFTMDRDSGFTFTNGCRADRAERQDSCKWCEPYPEAAADEQSMTCVIQVPYQVSEYRPPPPPTVPDEEDVRDLTDQEGPSCPSAMCP